MKDIIIYNLVKGKSLMKKMSLMLTLLALIGNVAFAQDQQISGKVLDETGDGLPGASVLIKGTSTGTVTDMEGSYSISAGSSDVLVVSFIGYSSQELNVGGRSVIDVTLDVDAEQLEEVVVTGYTSQRKRDITGAVTVVSATDLNVIKAPSFGQKLAGRAPGVTVSTSGSPGDGSNIRIRGVSSFNGSDPLIIIDGVQTQGDKSLNGLNPNDIESMQILKDASAASIYGARANAGVIIITTKQGKAGKLRVTYDGYVGRQTPVGAYSDFLIKDPKEFAVINVGKGQDPAFYGMSDDTDTPTIPVYFFPAGGRNDVDESAYAFPGNLVMRSNQEGTDWWDEIFSPALITEHNVGLSGGSENATFSSSVGYLKQEGTMMHTNFERFSARLNSRFNYGKFKFGESISVARSAQVTQQGGNQNEQNVMTQILKMNSIIPVYDINGNFAGSKTGNFSNGRSPVAFAYYNKDDIDTDTRVLSNVFGEFEIIDGLSVKSSFSFDYRQRFQPRANFARFEDREVNATTSYQETHQNNANYTWTNTINYKKTLADKHTIGVLAGTEAVRNKFHQINGTVNDPAFLDTDVRYLNLVYATFNTMNSTGRVVTMASLFGKLDYEFDDKYLLSATVRRDGSSDFGAEKYGVFPAFSVGWRVSNESFMDGVSWLDDLKIRAGYGVTGNANISTAYNAYDQWGGRNAYDAAYDITGAGGAVTAGFARFQYGNDLTSWEENTSSNIGIDASLVDGKVGVVFDLYKRDVTDLLYNAPFPGGSGNGRAYFANIADMTNTGWDLGLTYKDEIAADLNLNLGINLSHYRNEINALDGNANRVFPGGVDKRFGETNTWEVGQPLSSFFGFTQDGIFQNEAEVEALDQNGAAVGRFRWKDLNNDGQINDDDKGVIGNPHPDLTLGITVGLDYKNFDFSMFFFGSFGNEIYNYNKLFTHFGFFNANVSRDVFTDSWTPENPGASLPALDGGDSFSTESSSFYVEDGSYFRAQNMTLGYTFPQGSILGFESIRIYGQAQNLFTITGYSGIDPALSSVNVGTNNQNDGWAGFDFGNYPSSRSFMLGINARF